MAAQVFPQSILPSAEVTVPEPSRFTVRVKLRTPKRAVTLVSAVTVTVQVAAAPEQPPAQPSNEKPGAGLAVRVTMVPLS